LQTDLATIIVHRQGDGSALGVGVQNLMHALK
jgi:pyruvate/2-oxoacid:ferredoxin oxidoreductase beta subunit